MRFTRTVVAIGIVSLAVIGIATGCATARPSEYDGVPDISEVEGDSVEFVRITISNNRIRDASDPRFDIIGAGRHSLGRVHGYGGKLVRLIDTRWLNADGCLSVIAHWAGAGDWTSGEFCWHHGEAITVSLESILSTSNAWAHK